jgi:hypothetical protein
VIASVPGNALGSRNAIEQQSTESIVAIADN